MASAEPLAFERRPWPAPELQGRVELLEFESRLLAGAPGCTAALRCCALYTPPSSAQPRLPLVFLLPGYGATWRKYLELSPWQPGLLQRIDAAMAQGALPPALLALPDPWTVLGGSQWVDSDYNGAFSAHFARELVPLVQRAAAVDAERISIAGKSSGGFGALHLAFEHPGLLSAVASISGDCCFELCYAHEFPAALRAFARAAGQPERFLREFLAQPRLDADAHAAISLLALAACYSPARGEPLGFALPVDAFDARLRPAVWARWLAFDPLERVGPQGAALGKLRLLHLECGLADEYHLQWGLRRLVARLAQQGIAHRHEEHPGSHRGTDERFLRVLPDLIRA